MVIKKVAGEFRTLAGPIGRNGLGKTSYRACIIVHHLQECNTRFLRPGLKPTEAPFTRLRLARQRAGDLPSPRVDNRASSPLVLACSVLPAMRGLPGRANAAIGYARNRCMNGNFPRSGFRGAGRMTDVISIAAIRFLMVPQPLGYVPGIAEGGILSSAYDIKFNEV